MIEDLDVRPYLDTVLLSEDEGVEKFAKSWSELEETVRKALGSDN